MILLDSILIEEFRGIRKLELPLSGTNFAICGRNGTGKSGVVDAIEFVLTGNISRLSGEGTDKLSVKAHAPHVDSRNNPGKARVTLKATIPSLKKSVTITRIVSKPSEPIVTPATPDVLSVLQQIKDHPELVLTRREIIRFVLATDGDRSEEVQAVLKLDRLEYTRSTLRTIANAATKDAKGAQQSVDLTAQNLARTLDIARLAETDLLDAVNTRRALLGLGVVPSLTPTTSIKDGVSIPAAGATARLSKQAATADLANLRFLLGRLSRATADPDFTKAQERSRALSEDATLLKALAQDEFLEAGREFIDEPRCPFCDKEWDPAELRTHVAEKLKALEAVRKKRASAEEALEPIAALLAEVRRAVETVTKYCPLVIPVQPRESLDTYRVTLQSAVKTIGEFLPLADTLGILARPPMPSPAAEAVVKALEAHVVALPDPSKEEAAREYLIVGQERLEAYREARRIKQRLDAHAALATQVVDTYAATCDAELTQLYHDVQKDFAAMYGELNSPDEANFEARLLPSLGKLGFDVNFYGKGFFPPGAYHSEGHQDAMGLCLYLALMKHVLRENFRFAVLDDVLMSVDSGHRRAVCTMLRRRFKDTQFILTTHDPVWLNHMRTEGLIKSRSLIYFHSWDVSTGPAFWDDTDVWAQIRAELTKDRVPIAAELLRNYLEYIFGEVCQRLRARVEFRLDARKELGDLLPPACERMQDLYSKGKDAANSWKNTSLRGALDARQSALVKARTATAIDQWQVNAAIHYNAWASLTRQDFEPLVVAFQTLVQEFSCPEPTCQAFLAVLRDGVKDKSVDCPCGQSTFNLQSKASP